MSAKGLEYLNCDTEARIGWDLLASEVEIGGVSSF